MKNLEFIICGYERSGTTLLNEIFRNHPELDSGFEVGVLLANSIANFKTLNPYNRITTNGWGLTKSSFDYICQSKTYDEFYFRLKEKSPFINQNCKIFDKTPAYMGNLHNIVYMVDVPIVVLYKSPAEQFRGWTMVGHGAEEIINTKYSIFLNKYKNSVESYLKVKDNPKVMLVYYNDLVNNPDLMLDKIFKHVGYDYKPDYKNIKSKYLKTKILDNTHLGKYKIYLGNKLISKIENDCKTAFEALNQCKEVV